MNVNRKDTERNDKETTLYCMFYETNGDYMLGLVSALSGDHNASKMWLVSFDLSGNIIEYIPFSESYCGDVRTIEGEISKNLEVDIYELDFSGYNCIVDVNSFRPLSDLKGQRIDRHYQITPDGKFRLLQEVRYKPQIYTAETLMGKECIFQRAEEILKE